MKTERWYQRLACSLPRPLLQALLIYLVITLRSILVRQSPRRTPIASWN
jgi:hypothetical protein